MVQNLWMRDKFKCTWFLFNKHTKPAPFALCIRRNECTKYTHACLTITINRADKKQRINSKIHLNLKFVAKYKCRPNTHELMHTQTMFNKRPTHRIQM